MRTLYELCGAEEDRLFSAYSWRVRLTMGLKGLAFDNRPTPFTQIPHILDGAYKTVPVLIDGDTVMDQSFAICRYLEVNYPDTPSVFGGEGGISNAELIDNIIITSLYPTMSRIILKDIHDRLAPSDATYFRQSREKRFGKTLEDVVRGRDKERDKLHTFLKPYRRRLSAGPYLGGERLLFADVALTASFCWSKATSPYDLFAGDQVLQDWFDRVLDTCGQSAALKHAA